jgi:Aerotolerance regulator N-terminal
MTFLAPLFFMAALAVAAGAVALHFIVMRQPPSQWLPTVRFVPERDARAPTTSRRPEDLLLLLLRVLLILLVGAAFARPVWVPHRQAVYHIVAVDRSRAVASVREAADSARAAMASGAGTLVLFDSSAHATDVGVADSLRGPTRSTAPGSISAALVTALQTASKVRDRADSLELTIVSPFAKGELDAATDSIRALWPGAVRVVQVGARADSAPARVVVRWPSDGHAPGTIARTTRDTVGAVVAAGIAVVAPFERRWRLTTIDSARGQVVARWVDGEPAAVERASSPGDTTAACERDVAVAIPTAGDVVLRPEYQRFVDAMRAPCGGSGGAVAGDSGRSIGSDLDALRGQGPTRIAARAVAAASVVRVPLVPWLLGAALVAALGELVVRRRRSHG